MVGDCSRAMAVAFKRYSIRVTNSQTNHAIEALDVDPYSPGFDFF